MPSTDYDVIVVGVGGMGSAATFNMARRGARVLALEQFGIPNDRGSSHGSSRIIRLAYWEHPDYVPLVLRAYKLWTDLERLAGVELLEVTGSVDAGPPNSSLYAGALAAARAHHLQFEDLSSFELTERFPGFRFPSGHRAVFQPDGGRLDPEAAIGAYARLARSLGATIHTAERVKDWTAAEGQVSVATDQAVYSARELVITAGPWLGSLFGGFGDSLRVERQVVVWTRPKQPDLFERGRFPVFYADLPPGRFYGFPSDGIGFKIGKYHHQRELVDPDFIVRSPDVRDEEVLRDGLSYFPDANGPIVRSETCLFTNTPDENFVIGRLPGIPNATVCGGFSGHGFKFCSVVGEILADLALDGATRHPITLFSPTRAILRPSL